MHSTGFFTQILTAGIAATVVFDLWQVLVRWVFGVRPTNWALVGRWVCGLPRGKLVHDALSKEPVRRFERVAGWVTHYAVGIIYAALYAGLVVRYADAPSTLTAALAFSLAALVAPWFILHPAMGLGVLASKAPVPALARAHTLSSHLAFGIGLYLGFGLLPGGLPG